LCAQKKKSRLMTSTLSTADSGPTSHLVVGNDRIFATVSEENIGVDVWALVSGESTLVMVVRLVHLLTVTSI
jgi:hypothetical protein